MSQRLNFDPELGTNLNSNATQVVISTNPFEFNEEKEIQWGEVGLGSLQLVGGATETILGFGIATGGTAASGGLAGAAAIGGGGYLMIDGVSNVTGGGSKVWNGFTGSEKGDNWNFMKKSFKTISPNHGIDIYNGTQLGIGLFCIGKGITQLPSNAANVTKSYWGYQAVANGSKTVTEITHTGQIVRINTWTTGGALVKTIGIDTLKITTGTLLIGVDVTNSSLAAGSINPQPEPSYAPSPTSTPKPKN